MEQKNKTCQVLAELLRDVSIVVCSGWFESFNRIWLLLAEIKQVSRECIKISFTFHILSFLSYTLPTQKKLTYLALFVYMFNLLRGKTG